MLKLRLCDGTIYTVFDYATQNRFIIFLDSTTASEVLKSLTEKNLSEIQFLTDEGAITGTYYNKLLCGYTDNGSMLEISINDADLCRYGLVLDENNRIIGASVQRYAPENAIIIDTLPEGNLSDYLYINNEFVYNSLPKEEQQEEAKPTTEGRLTELETALSMLLEGVTE